MHLLHNLHLLLIPSFLLQFFHSIPSFPLCPPPPVPSYSHLATRAPQSITLFCVPLVVGLLGWQGSGVGGLCRGPEPHRRLACLSFFPTQNPQQESIFLEMY